MPLPELVRQHPSENPAASVRAKWVRTMLVGGGAVDQVRVQTGGNRERGTADTADED